MTERPAMTKVPSHAIERVGYLPQRSELWIEYSGGDTYIYAMVPASLHRELMASDSAGRFVNERIKPTFPVRDA